MVDTKTVRKALRQLRAEQKMSPDALAAKSGVDRATIYRIEDLNADYSPRIETVGALVEALGSTTTMFFWNIEGLTHHLDPSLTSPVTETDQGSVRSTVSAGGSPDVPASERTKLRRQIAVILTEITRCETRLATARRAARDMAKLPAVRGQGEATTRRRA
jgi:DNA-binding XRE family transcriptional regulator